ncbi:prolyl-tRNA synthetase associated domain-containing protein [Alkaliphilus serpentinus]|uniref:Prolyl-tRNA synthetase associated domain-containing protein n=1 Tax=Alkaliphilus serpentinus TaxID=1482731 RepID=A0A833HLC2_9FIRM|nr:prolyl-tRNA synthetase associated domain-containing protein [Alkaliphilus serpentinus]KAB3525616.1 prolyl-tRNA synthetase associated domain-containing protein [Alkaliphilus serpentinus]
MDKQQPVYKNLDQLKIHYSVTQHPAVFTIEEMEALGITKEGDVVKNLFLRDAKGKRHFLVVLDKDKRAELSNISQQLGSTKLSFASEERLQKHLKLSKGAVTPLGVINDESGSVEVVFDQDLIGKEKLGVHPNDNTATLWISYEDLVKVIEETRHKIVYIQI